MHLFFAPDIESDLYFFSEEESKHCIRVLRLRLGDELVLIDGKGFWYEVKIINDAPKKVGVEVLKKEFHRPTRKYKFHLAFSPTKNIERIEWMLEKCTEIGIDEFTPIICARSERKEIKKDRLERILISAIKQSMNPYLPILNDPVKFSEFVNKYANQNSIFLAHCEEGEKKFLKEFPASETTEMIVMIGPEGDFSREEIDQANENGIKFITLGESRLRSETACIAALMEAVFINR